MSTKSQCCCPSDDMCPDWVSIVLYSDDMCPDWVSVVLVMICVLIGSVLLS